MTDQPEPTLKPCPFCGSKDVKLLIDVTDGEGKSGFAVGCLNFGCWAVGPVRQDESAIKYWNRRKP